MAGEPLVLIEDMVPQNPLSAMLNQNQTLLYETCIQAGFISELPRKFLVYLWILAGLIILLVLWNLWINRRKVLKLLGIHLDDEPDEETE